MGVNWPTRELGRVQVPGPEDQHHDDDQPGHQAGPGRGEGLAPPAPTEAVPPRAVPEVVEVVEVGVLGEGQADS